MTNNNKNNGSANDFFLEMNIHIVSHHGKPALQLRKVITLCEKNAPLFEQIIKASFSDGQVEITAPVSICFKDKLKARAKLKEIGYVLD